MLCYVERMMRILIKSQEGNKERIDIKRIVEKLEKKFKKIKKKTKEKKNRRKNKKEL